MPVSAPPATDADSCAELDIPIGPELSLLVSVDLRLHPPVSMRCLNSYYKEPAGISRSSMQVAEAWGHGWGLRPDSVLGEGADMRLTYAPAPSAGKGWTEMYGRPLINHGRRNA